MTMKTAAEKRLSSSRTIRCSASIAAAEPPMTTYLDGP